MNVQVIAIGNEVLTGAITNTNAAFISQALLKEGYRVVRHLVLPDDPVLLEKGLAEALQQTPIVITTGGLGPTLDDLTRQIAGKLFSSEFYVDPEILSSLTARYGSGFSTLTDQATVPHNAVVLKNSLGTAPGFIFRSENSMLIILPGVPQEMKALLEEQVIPYLRQLFPKENTRYSKALHLFGVPENHVDPFLRQIQKEYPHIECGIYPGQGILSVQLTVHAKSEQTAWDILDPPLQMLQQTFHTNAFFSPTGKLEEAIQHSFIKKGLTLSAAESCTGGHFSARLTQITGASAYFLGSLVTYSNALKMELLGVPEELLKEKGAVSKEVASYMLQGLLERTRSDYGVAVTGIMGPTGGTEKKPIGTVWCAVGRRDEKAKVWEFFARGNRAMAMERTVNILLSELLQQVNSL